MPANPFDDPQQSRESVIVPGPARLRHYPAYDLLAWQPQGILDDILLEEIGEWLCTIDRSMSPPVRRFVDLSQLTSVAVRTNHIYEFAQKRKDEFAAATPVRSAVFARDWIGLGIARLYEGLMAGSPVEVRAFQDRAKAAVWLNVPAEILNVENQTSPAP